MVKKIYSVLLILIFLQLAVYAQTSGIEGHLCADIQIYGGDTIPPVILDSERGWVTVGAVDWEKTHIQQPMENENRKWRLKTTYFLEENRGPATIQIRLRGPSGSPVFTLPWSDGGNYNYNKAYSNWYIDKDLSLGNSGRGYIEARLIAPPHTPLKGKIYSISLEGWDENISGGKAVKTIEEQNNVQLAYTRPLPFSKTAEPSDKENKIEDALEFSLEFIDACINGDLPAYYRLQADPVRSLDTGKALPKYKLTPPNGIPGIKTINDYKRRFEYKIYSADKFRELFPEWFDTSREWVPSENSYLFMGHKDRLSQPVPANADYLVFLVEQDENGDWKVKARPF